MSLTNEDMNPTAPQIRTQAIMNELSASSIWCVMYAFPAGLVFSSGIGSE